MALKNRKVKLKEIVFNIVNFHLSAVLQLLAWLLLFSCFHIGSNLLMCGVCV